MSNGMYVKANGEDIFGENREVLDQNQAKPYSEALEYLLSLTAHYYLASWSAYECDYYDDMEALKADTIEARTMLISGIKFTSFLYDQPIDDIIKQIEHCDEEAYVGLINPEWFKRKEIKTD